MRRENRILSTVLVGIVAVVGLIAIMKLSGRTDIPKAPLHTVVGGDPAQASVAFASYGCVACHTIQGIDNVKGQVGPELDEHFAERAYIAGKLSNTPDNLIRWLQVPQAVDPGNAMPNLGVTRSDAANMAAYFYSLQ